MSLYNMVNGVNPATFLLLPMLGKHPDEYPRFRDCFAGRMTNSKESDDFGIPQKQLSFEEKVISVYTRVGGANRDSYITEIEMLKAIPTYIEDYDDDFDSTFATFIFKVPEEWLPDYSAILDWDMGKVSKKYQKQMVKVFPKLKEKFTEMFKV